jgi:HSP20 family protein
MGSKDKKSEKSRGLSAGTSRALWTLEGRNPFRVSSAIWDERRLAGTLESAVDVTENDNSYAITVELPGSKRDDVSVEVHGDVIEVRGEKRSEREEKDERRHVIERSYGSFSRSFSLPANADAERISASFKDGVLTIDIPKAQESKPKQVDIKGDQAPGRRCGSTRLRNAALAMLRSSLGGLSRRSQHQSRVRPERRQRVARAGIALRASSHFFADLWVAAGLAFAAALRSRVRHGRSERRSSA